MMRLKEFFTIKMVYFRPYPNIPVFQYSSIPYKFTIFNGIFKEIIDRFDFFNTK